VAEDGNLDDRAADGVAHLQAAARELIAAARAMLDVAEDLVADPGAVTAVVDAFGSIVRTAARAARDATATVHEADDDDRHGVERIQVG
jgi:hypothetical protein